MKKLLLFPILFLTALSWGQMNSYSTASLSAACTNTTTSCSSVANSQALVNTVGFNVASITVHGTYTGLTLNFDVSDDGGVTWYQDTCTRGDTPIQEVSEAVTNSAIRQWDCGVSGTSNFRVRNNAITTGADVIGITLSVSNIEPAPTVSVSGTIATSTTLGTSTNVIGKVGIDQTTPGTTNAVSTTNLPTTVDTNTGTSGANTLRVAQGSGPWTSTIQQGGNSATVSVGGALKVDGSAVTQPVSGTVTSNIGTTNGLALDASVTGLQVSQGSTTSGQKGGLGLAAVTTSAPSYTTAQSSPLSLTPVGNLRVDGSSVTQPVSGTITANAGTGNFTVVQPTGTNLHAVLDTTSTTAVTQATGSNLHAQLDSGSTTAVTQATGANLHTVIDSGAVTNTPPANQSVNVSQMNGVTTSMGNGTTDTGTQRVSISSDSTGQVKSTNFPTTVDTNSGAPGASTLRTVPATSTPADATSNTSIPGTQVYLMSFNGTTWDRVRSISGAPGSLAVAANTAGSDAQNNANGMGIAGSGVALPLQTWGNLFNNSTWDRARSGASANLPNLIGSTLVANVTVDPCASSAVTKSHAFANITTATTTALVPVSGSTNIFVCGIDLQSLSTVATNTILFESGTGSACAVVTGCISAGICTSTFRNGAVATYPPIHLGFGGQTLFSTGASNGLCAVTTVGTGPTISVDVTYVQQ